MQELPFDLRLISTGHEYGGGGKWRECIVMNVWDCVREGVIRVDVLLWVLVCWFFVCGKEWSK